MTRQQINTSCQGDDKAFRRLQRRKGATLFEYAVIIAIVSIVAIAVLTGIGSTTNNKLAPVTNGFN